MFKPINFTKNSPILNKPPNPNFPFNHQLQTFLSGRQLLLDEIPFTPEDIHEHLENGYLIFRTGFKKIGNKFTCQRCGNQESHLIAMYPCARCQRRCHYCRKCIMMGRVSSCSSLVGWNGPIPEYPQSGLPVLRWEGTLSQGQIQASAKVVEAVQSHTDLLCWAVCGAGKTEVLFAGIEVALVSGKRVCVATPRTDVVLELTPRIRKVFPTVSLTSLYSGSEQRHDFGQLTIATTHQLLRFYQAFDVMIVDEVDAFPYTADESLQYAVRQARKPESTLIFLTATPSEKWQRECKLGKRNYVTISARFHGHPLPVPTFRWCGNWKKQLEKGAIPKNIHEWTETRHKLGKQALIFFPNIRLMQKALPIFQALDERVEAVHAEDSLRKEKVKKMRDGDTPILLTTSILERGVTFPNLDVAVVGSEEPVFTESALVQISGRVGRSAEFPTGNITFFHYGISEAMTKARNQINTMNKQARKGNDTPLL